MLKSVKEKLTTKKNYKSIFISDFYNNLRHINNNFSDKDSSVEKTFELAG